jgi:hypothetical protein
MWMSTKKLLEKVAYLEFVNDQMSAELQYLDSLLKSVGFSDGLKSVKCAAQEILEQEQNSQDLGAQSQEQGAQDEEKNNDRETA